MKTSAGLFLLAGCLASGFFLSGCSVERPVLRDASLATLPSTAGDGLIRFDVVLDLINPNAEGFTITSSHLELLETRDGVDAVFARGRIEGTIIIPPSPRANDGTEALQPIHVPVTLLLEKASLDSNALVVIKSGRARIRGELITSRGFPWPPIAMEINTPIPKLPGAPNGSPSHERFEPRISAFKSVIVGLTPEGRMRLQVHMVVDNPSGKAITLGDLTLALSAPATRTPLRLAVQEPLVLTADATQEADIVAIADMEDCDATLFDDIVANGLKALVEFEGTFTTDALDNMRFDEKREIVFPDSSSPATNRAQVIVENIDHAALIKLLKLNEWPMALLSNNILTSVRGLLKGEATPVSMPIHNPIPGTVGIEIRKLRLLSPPRRDRHGGSEEPHVVLLIDSDRQTLPPRNSGNVVVRVTVGPHIAHAALFYLEEVLPHADARKGFTLEQQYVVDIPLFGSIPIETKTVYE